MSELTDCINNLSAENILRGATKKGFYINTMGLGGWTPADLPNLILWLDSTVGISIDVGVELWQDQSGQDNHMVQNVDANQPTYNASDANFNNLPSIESDGLNDWMDFTSQIDLAAGFSICGVIDIDGYWFGNDFSTARYCDHQTGSDVIRTSTAITGFNYNNDPVGSLLVEFHRTAGLINGFKNTVASISNPAANAGTAQFNALFRRSTTYTDTKIAEVVVCSDEMSDADKVNLRAYMSDKYNFTTVY